MEERPLGDPPDRGLRSSSSLATTSTTMMPRSSSHSQSLGAPGSPRLRAAANATLRPNGPTLALWGEAGRSLPTLEGMLQGGNSNGLNGEVPTNDIEDLIAVAPREATAASESLVDEIVEAAPLRRVSFDEDERRCPSCRRSDCPTLRPPVGAYSLQAVARHASPGDCWLVADGHVYDASRFMAKHPGGLAPILRRAGGREDCAADMAFHSERARKLWQSLRVGRVVRCPYPPVVPSLVSAPVPGGDGESGFFPPRPTSSSSCALS